MSMFHELMMRKKGGSGGTLNATVVGKPTISNDFILSNCSNNDYLTIVLGDIILANYTNWKICFKIKFVAQQLVLVFDGISNFKNTRIQFFHPDLSDNCSWMLGGGEGWLSASSVNIPNLQTNLWYYFKFCFDGTSYYIEYGTDGINFTKINVYSSSNRTFFNSENTRIFIPDRNLTLTKEVKAELDLKETNIYANNNKVWEAVSF